MSIYLSVSQINPQKNVMYVCVFVFVCVNGGGGRGAADYAEVWYKVFASTDRKLITQMGVEYKQKLAKKKKKDHVITHMSEAAKLLPLASCKPITA